MGIERLRRAGQRRPALDLLQQRTDVIRLRLVLVEACLAHATGNVPFAGTGEPDLLRPHAPRNQAPASTGFGASVEP